MPVEVFAMNLTATALRLFAAMRIRGELHGDVYVWRGPLTDLVKGWDIPKSTITGGLANLAVNGLIRQEQAGAEPGKIGRPSFVYVSPAFGPTKSVSPYQFVESGAGGLVSKSVSPYQFTESENASPTLAAYNTTTATTAPDLVREFEQIAALVLVELGEKKPPEYLKRFKLQRVVGALADLDYRISLAERGVASGVRNQLGWLNDRLVHQPDFAWPADISWARRWLPATVLAELRGIGPVKPASTEDLICWRQDCRGVHHDEGEDYCPEHRAVPGRLREMWREKRQEVTR